MEADIMTHPTNKLSDQDLLQATLPKMESYQMKNNSIDSPLQSPQQSVATMENSLTNQEYINNNVEEIDQVRAHQGIYNTGKTYLLLIFLTFFFETLIFYFDEISKKIDIVLFIFEQILLSQDLNVFFV